jgi:predicted RNA-binding Zn-ribbon protein involved in translation (DUF1610 family)
MTLFYCPKCEKERYVLRCKFGRILKKGKTWAEAEVLCPKCYLFIGRETLVDMKEKDFKRRGNAPKNYKKCFKSIPVGDN